MHCDTAYECFTKNQQFYVNRLAVSGEQGKSFEKWYQTFAVWIKETTENPYLLYKNILKSFKEKLKEKPDNLTPIFAVEGGSVLENDAERLFELKKDGIRFLSLTWNGENAIAGGVESQKGLTDFGRKTINLLNGLKIGCDLSHLNQKSFYSALELADFPLATHSNCKQICSHERNLSTDQIRTLCAKGGIIGLCFYPDFLGCNVFERLYQNIFLLCDMGFENNIAIGSDFDGGVMDSSLKNLCQVPSLYSYLLSKGLHDSLLNKIFSENAHKFIAKIS